MAQAPYFNDDDADYAPLSPNLNPQYANYDQESLPVHPQHHQSFRASVSHISPFSPTGNTDYFGRGLSLTSPYPHTNQQQFDMNTMVKPETTEEEAYGAPKRKRGPGKKAKQEQNNKEMSEEPVHESASGGIDVKTKFPVARIKRIMQADEDVGKVAQVTPVVVSKALELFMISIVTKAASEARARNSKRVLPAHLKAAILADEQFDFLNDIVSKVQDAPAPGSGKANDQDSDEPETKKKPRGRKKKAVDTEMS